MNDKILAIHSCEHFLFFNLADKECGIPMSWVKKLVLYKDWSSFESTPQYQDGMLFHQNQQIPLLDLRRFLGFSNRRKGSVASVLITDINGDVYGVIVDNIADAVYVDNNTIDFNAPLLSDFNTDYIHGFAQHGQSNVVLLRLDRIISEEMSTNAKSTLLSV
jgi:purine-binding chemotaxis protein CheW